MAEATDLKPVKCGFESHYSYLSLEGKGYVKKSRWEADLTAY